MSHLTRSSVQPWVFGPASYVKTHSVLLPLLSFDSLDSAVPTETRNVAPLQFSLYLSPFRATLSPVRPLNHMHCCLYIFPILLFGHIHTLPVVSSMNKMPRSAAWRCRFQGSTPTAPPSQMCVYKTRNQNPSPNSTIFVVPPLWALIPLKFVWWLNLINLHTISLWPNYELLSLVRCKYISMYLDCVRIEHWFLIWWKPHFYVGIWLLMVLWG